MSELLSAPHHDGSEVHVPEPASAPGDETTVLLRVPREAAVDVVVLRYLRDGEPRAVVARVDRVTEAAERTLKSGLPEPSGDRP